ncbi:MAG: RNA polymerase sigma factor [Bacteroidota bacterium]
MNALEFDHEIVNARLFLRPFALRLTKSHEEADDLIQETMVKAISNREKFKRGTNLKAWLSTIMRNTFITQYHRNNRRRAFIDQSVGLNYLNSSYGTDENKGVENLHLEAIEKALNHLEYEFKTPFLMYYTGYKYREIAEALDMPLGSVKNRIHIARKRLQQVLKQN